MKTKQIPAVVMLTAGFIICVISIFQEMELDKFLKLLVCVLLIFYILGSIIRVVLDKNFKEMKEEAETEGEQSEDVSEEQKKGEDSEEGSSDKEEKK